MAQVRKRWYQVDPAYDGGLVTLVGTRGPAGPGEILEVDLNSGEYHDIVTGSVSDHSNYVKRREALEAAINEGILNGPFEGGEGEYTTALNLASLTEGFELLDLPGLSGTIDSVSYEVVTPTTDGDSEVTLSVVYGDNEAELVLDGSAQTASFDGSDVEVTDRLVIAVEDAETPFTDGAGILRITVEP